jgi:hypothetical protein
MTYFRARETMYLESLAELAGSEARVEWQVNGEWLTTEQARAIDAAQLRHFRLRGINAVLLQERIEPGFQFRITGDDGNSYWKKIESKQELCGMYDFELDANSANSNKQAQIEQANMVYQMTANPIDLQLGIVTPANRYEALVNMLKVNGIKSVAKYATKPANAAFNPSPVEMLNRILMGIDVPFNPTMDLESFIRICQEFMESDELNGQFGPNEMAVVAAKAQEAMQLMQAIQQAQAQAAVGQQQYANTQASMTPTGSPQQGGPIAVQQQAPDGQGG